MSDQSLQDYGYSQSVEIKKLSIFGLYKKKRVSYLSNAAQESEVFSVCRSNEGQRDGDMCD